MDVIANNVANIETTNIGDGTPYLRQLVRFEPRVESDFEALFKKYGDLAGLPEMKDVLIGMKRPELDQDEGKAEPPGKPSITTRENIRTNVSQGTRDGQSEVLAQMLASQGQGAGRPPG